METTAVIKGTALMKEVTAATKNVALMKEDALLKTVAAAAAEDTAVTAATRTCILIGKSTST